jgi:hypothetical protein
MDAKFTRKIIPQSRYSMTVVYESSYIIKMVGDDLKIHLTFLLA